MSYFLYIFFFYRLTVVLSVVLQLIIDEGDYPENSHVVFCPNKQRSFLTFYAFGSSFRALAVAVILFFVSVLLYVHRNHQAY